MSFEGEVVVGSGHSVDRAAALIGRLCRSGDCGSGRLWVGVTVGRVTVGVEQLGR